MKVGWKFVNIFKPFHDSNEFSLTKWNDYLFCIFVIFLPNKMRSWLPNLFRSNLRRMFFLKTGNKKKTNANWKCGCLHRVIGNNRLDASPLLLDSGRVSLLLTVKLNIVSPIYTRNIPGNTVYWYTNFDIVSKLRFIQLKLNGYNCSFYRRLPSKHLPCRPAIKTGIRVVKSMLAI
jgi:hypothetical protein